MERVAERVLSASVGSPSRSRGRRGAVDAAASSSRQDDEQSGRRGDLLVTSCVSPTSVVSPPLCPLLRESHHGGRDVEGRRSAASAAARASSRRYSARGTSRDAERREVRGLPLGVDEPVLDRRRAARPARPARPSRRRSRGGTSTPRRTGRRWRRRTGRRRGAPSRQVSTECTQPSSWSRRYAVTDLVVDPARRPRAGRRRRRSPRRRRCRPGSRSGAPTWRSDRRHPQVARAQHARGVPG